VVVIWRSFFSAEACSRPFFLRPGDAKLPNRLVADLKNFLTRFTIEQNLTVYRSSADAPAIFYLLSLLQNDDFRSKSRHAKNFYRRHIIDIPRIKN
jgi:hypothetical protein